jgi:hypothetical protein
LEFYIFAGLPASIDDSVALWISVPRPTSGFAAGTYQLDPDPFSANPAAYAILYVFDNNDEVSQMLYATSGSVTFTSVTRVAGGILPVGQNNGDTFVGSLSLTLYKEIDLDTGLQITGGCTTALEGLSFNLRQNMVVNAPAPSALAPSGFAPKQKLRRPMRAQTGFSIRQ